MFGRVSVGGTASLSFMLLRVIAGVAAYFGFALFVARMLSDKWHPQVIYPEEWSQE